VQDTSKFWYKPDISRDQGTLPEAASGPNEEKKLKSPPHTHVSLHAAILVLKDKEPGCFIVRDSHSFRGAYGLAMKVATPPPSVLQQTKKGTGDVDDRK